MAKYILRVNGEAYVMDYDREVVNRFYVICKKYVSESLLAITFEVV